MSFNKSKAMRNAERYLTQGKIQAAISEYKQIVEHEPRDVNSRNMLGDLYMKAEETQAAVNCYKEVAGHYFTQGFAKKAIAIYNKIYRIEPESLEIALKLADLYQTRGSMAEAQKHYEDIARRYEEKGRKAEALAIWEKIADIAPKDTQIYIKIADAYWQDDRKTEAAEAFVQAGSRFLEAEKYESAVTAFDRSLEINPDDMFALRGFVQSQIKLGYPEEGVKALGEQLEKQPYNRELNYLMMDCYFDMDEPARAEELIVRLVEREPANYSKLLDLVRVYLESDDLDSAARVLQMTAEHMLVGGETEELLELLNEVLARDPEHIAGLRMLAHFHGWQKDEAELRESLKRLSEAARLNDAVDDERYALSQYLRLVPHDVERLERLKQLNATHDFAEEPPREDLLNSASKEVPKFESYAGLSGDESNSSEGFQVVTESNIIIGEEFVEGADHAFAGNGSRGVSFREDLNGSGAPFAETSNGHHPEAPDGTAPPESASGIAAEEFDESELSPAEEMKISEEIESIRFYIDEGYGSLAEKALAELEQNYGNRREFAVLRGELNGSAETVAEKVPAEVLAAPATPETEPEETREFDIVPAVPVPAEMFEESASEAGEAPDAEPEPGPPAAIEEPVAEASGEAPAEAENVTVAETRDPLNSFESLRDELGIEDEEPARDDDFEGHYQHAVVYREMGMIEEALREFQDAVNCVGANDGTRRFLNCCTLIGHCFMQKEMPNLAYKWFERALETKDLKIDEKQGVYYELANALEANGKPEKAFEYFEMIYAVDVDYRDVSARLESLREKVPTPA